MVVDDEPDMESLIRQRFRREIKENLYEFTFAQNGVEALKQMEENQLIECILTDINMPMMDGLTLLSRVGELSRETLRSVVISAYGDIENIRTAMNRGAYDFLTKPIDASDLVITITKTIKDIEARKEAIVVRDEMMKQKSALASAQRILEACQRDLKKTFPMKRNFEIAVKMRSAENVGGDFYDAFPIDETCIGIVIGDVTGKGLPAALSMVTALTTVRAFASSILHPGECLQKVNDILFRDKLGDDHGRDIFVTIFYGVLNVHTGEFNYCSAGHNLPYNVSASGAVSMLERTGGTVIGMLEGMTYKDKSIQLQAGDRLFLYTDGVTEAMDRALDMYSEERIEKALADFHDKKETEFLHAIWDDIHAFTGGAAQSDDITMMLLRYDGNGRI